MRNKRPRLHTPRVYRSVRNNITPCSIIWEFHQQYQRVLDPLTSVVYE